MWPFKEKPLCAFCKERKTSETDELGAPRCSGCELKQRMEREPKHSCPVDGVVMTKEAHLVGQLIIDRCSVCGGVWLAKHELEQIKEAVEEEGSNSGFGNGLLLGIIIG